MSLFHGLSAFPLTPTDRAGNVEKALLGRLLDRIVAAQADSIGLLGSTGGYAYLSREQRQVAVRTAVDHVAGQVPIIVGVGALRTDVAAELAKDARAAGADGLLLAPMSYTPLTDEEVFQHFAAVAEAGELPLCIYNNPSTTRFSFTDDLIIRLSSLPNVNAVKMPLAADGDFRGELHRLRARTPGSFSIGYSGDWGAADALLAGCDTWYSVIAGLLPEEALALTRAAKTGDRKTVERLNAALQPLWTLFQKFGSFRVMYGIIEAQGVGRILPPRPILPLPSSERDAIDHALDVLTSAMKYAD
ncbi:dihydrodipicolinate synthase family protein [Tianweitania sp.]|uniref:dihydrodipicolinate synthase family protein n=1 Tax=Tianweitania sp. TaxID=2021634 RepID=UPI002897CB7B|nr:dihydrodipicolinate synthase family protein [Tianweitania sp.]